MINFKNKAEVVPSAVVVASIIVMLGTLLVGLFVPKPTVAKVATAGQNNVKTVEAQIDAAKTRTQQSEAAAAPNLWQGDPQTIMARVLAQMSDSAARGHVQMSSFRPQKQQTISGVIELPFNAQLTGPYPAVRHLLADLDQPNSHIVLRSVQVASSDGSTDTVTAQVGISVYTLDTTAAASAAGGGAARPRTTTTTTTTKTSKTPAAATPAAGGANGG